MVVAVAVRWSVCSRRSWYRASRSSRRWDSRRRCAASAVISGCWVVMSVSGSQVVVEVEFACPVEPGVGGEIAHPLPVCVIGVVAGVGGGVERPDLLDRAQQGVPLLARRV